MSHKVKAVVDRFEDSKAVLLLGDEESQAVWPRAFLPEGTAEGSILMVTLAVDAAATRLARGQAEDLLRQVLRQNEPKSEK